MGNIVRISYTNSSNTTSVSGKVEYWGDTRELYKGNRVVPNYLAPVVVSNIWGGETDDIQHLVYKYWSLEFVVKESEVQEISKLKSCSSIFISDLTSNLTHELDTQTAENLVIAEPEAIADTSNFLIKINYRTEKRIIDKVKDLDNVITLQGDNPYYSKFPKLVNVIENEKIAIEWNDTTFDSVYEVAKTSYKTVLYLSDAELETFKADYQNNDFTIDGETVIEKLPLESSELAIDLNLVVVYYVTVRTIVDIINTLGDVVTLLSASTNSYTSKLPKLTHTIENNNTTIEWSDGTTKVLRENTTVGYKVLLYLNDTELSQFYEDYGQFDFQIDGEDIIFKNSIEVAGLGENLNSVLVNAVTENLVSTDLAQTFELQTNHLSLFGGAQNFYTDYPLIPGYRDTDIKNSPNNEGVLVTSKTINYDVSEARFYLTNAQAQVLKESFAVSDDIELNGLPVIENNNISVEEIAYNINLVIVKCLIDSDVTYQQMA